MRKIGAESIIWFIALFTLTVLLSVVADQLSFGFADRQGFGVLNALAAVVFLYGAAIVVYRSFLAFWPLSEGNLAPGSRQETIANINILFYLIFFNTLIRTNFLPVPFTRPLYRSLGAKLGKNTYSAGAILDPPLTSIGADCVIGHNAVIFAHAIERSSLSLARVSIGDRVTIGASAIVMSGVRIGDDALVAAGAVVMKGTVIGAGEEWGGIPAKRLRRPPVESEPASSMAFTGTEPLTSAARVEDS